MPNTVKTRIIRSLSRDPWHNLALEELLLSRVEEGEVILYLWQNENTVVIGRNQNAWKECRCRLLEEEGGKLARRLSGGGAVFHDLGNLNFTFLMDRKLYDLHRQLEVILQAVRDLGIEAEFSGRNDLTVCGKKFSGNAFYFDPDSCYHHGTILLNTDFSKLTRYLQVSREKIASKGIDSVRARVVNLQELSPQATVENVIPRLMDSFANRYAPPEVTTEIDPENPPTQLSASLNELYEKYSSWQWRYGQTPKFDVTFSHRFPWGEVEIVLGLHRGRITSSVIYSDAMDADLIEDIAVRLKGLPFKLGDIVQTLDKIPGTQQQREIIADLKEWLLSKNFA